MTLGNRQHHINQAETARQRAEQYEQNALEADWPEDREFWKREAAHWKLQYQLNASLVEEMAE